jgi:hypothetical protein
MMRLSVGTILMLCAHSSAYAQSSAAVIGPGTVTCAQYAQSYKRSPANADAVYMSWAQGFLSGWKLSLLDKGDPARRNLGAKTPEQMTDHIHLFCDQNPLKPFFLAALDFYETLPAKKQ